MNLIAMDNIITKNHNIKITYGLLPIYEEENHRPKGFIFDGTIIVIDDKEILFNKTFKSSDFIDRRTIKLSEHFKNLLINNRNLIKDMFINGKKVENYFDIYDTNKNIFHILFKLDNEYIEEQYVYVENYEI